MKTLDEVIAYFDNQTQQRHVYLTEDAEDIYNDALHYLKEYKAQKVDIVMQREDLEREKYRYQEAVKNCEVAENKYKAEYQKQHEQQMLYLAENTKDNPPLGWDQLKQMEGKPVWVEALLYKQWAIIAYVGDEHIRFEGANLYAPESRTYMGKDNGWQAYRKERE